MTRNQEYAKLIFINRNKGKDLPDQFWKKVPYKFQYSKIIKCIGAVAKGTYCDEKYSDEAIQNAIIKKRICFWKYEKDIPRVHYFIQIEQELLNKKNIPKDFSGKEEEEKKEEMLKDYRTKEEASIRNKEKTLLDIEEGI